MQLSSQGSSFGFVDSAYNIVEGTLRLEDGALVFSGKPHPRIPLGDIRQAEFRYPRTLIVRTDSQSYKFLARGRAKRETVGQDIEYLLSFISPSGPNSTSKQYDPAPVMQHWQALLEEQTVPVRVVKGLKFWHIVVAVIGLSAIGLAAMIILNALSARGA